MPRPLPPRRLTRHRLLAALCVAAAGAAAAGAAPAQAGFFSGVTVAGPSPDLQTPGNVSIARDSSGAAVWLAQAGGTPHVFAAALPAGRTWHAPVQIDGGLAGPASAPIAAAAQSGRVAVVFVEGGTLYAAVKDSGASSFSSPQPIASGAANPTLAISANGTAYVAFAAGGPAGPQADVYAARLDRLSDAFSTYSSPLNLDPARAGGDGPATRPQIAVGTDGQALVTWGEAGADGRTHVIARRLAGQGPSPSVQDLTLPSLNGAAGGSADSPFAALRDASDFGWVVFRQTFISGGVAQSRAIGRFERGSSFQPPDTIDPLTGPSPDGAAAPQLSIAGTGSGYMVLEMTASHDVFYDPILDPASVMDPELGTPARVDSIPANAIAPQPVVAVGGIDDLGAFAWEQSSGPAGPVAVHVRAITVAGIGSEGVASDPALGPVDPAQGGLTGAADHYGDAFFLFAQGSGPSRRMVIGGYANPPGDFDLTSPSTFTGRRPRLSWSAAKDPLGVSYEVHVDGRVLGTVSGQSFHVPVGLSRGRHRVLVVAVDHFGQRTPSPGHEIRVGASAPKRKKKK